MVDLSRPLRAFNVDTYGEGKTGPLDHAFRFVGTRADFHALIRHVALNGQPKEVVGAWCPVDARTRDTGGTYTTNAGREYASSTQVARQLANITGSCASVFLDIDKISGDEWAEFCAKVRARGWNGLAWSTASCSQETISTRVLLHLDRELISADEVKRVRMGVSQVLGNLGDRATFQAAAVFYKPATRGYQFVEVFDGPHEIAVDRLPQPALVSRPLKDRPVPEGYVANATDMGRAEEELDGLARRIRNCTAHLRALTELATYHVGKRIAAGVLDKGSAIAVLTAAVEYQHATHGDATATLGERVSQIHSGIEDGILLGGALPPEEATPKERVADAAKQETNLVTLDRALARAREIAEGGEAAILALPPGAGKTRAILAQVAEGHLPATIYTPSHELAEEHRAALESLGVPADAIYHEMSPLHRPVGGVEACGRSVLSREAASTPDNEPSPFAVTVRNAHVNLQATVCPSCPARATCSAFTQQAPDDVRVKLAVHAAYRTPDPGKVGTRLVVLDEEPAPLELLKLTRAQIKLVTDRHPGPLTFLTGAEHWNWTPAQVSAAQLAAQRELELSEGDAPREFDIGQAYYVRRAALDLRAGRPVADDVAAGLRKFSGNVRLARHVSEALAQRPWDALPVGYDELEVVRSVIRLGAAGVAVERQPDGSVQAVVPTDARRDVMRGVARLLSATPTPQAYGSLAIYAPQVEDGCAGVTRRVLYHCEASNTEMKTNPKRSLDRAAKLLAAFPLAAAANPRVLVVTHKLLVDQHAEAIRAMLPGKEVVFRHFGNVAGSNLFQEGGALEVSAVITLGDYYANRRWLFDHLANEAGLEGEDAWTFVQDCGRKQIAQELAQAHGRARDPRRTTPLEHVHLGREVPDGWEGRFVQQGLVESRAERQNMLHGLLMLVLSLKGNSITSVGYACGTGQARVSHWVAKREPIPDKYESVLRRLLGLD